jgi:outer membrane lipoprotein-sorting protein
MSNLLRRLPLSRLLLLCATIVAVGIGATALATALSTGPTPPPKPLAEAVHDALAAGVGGQVPSDGVSARIQFTDHLVEASSLASQTGGGGGIASSPLLTGASGRLWIAADGQVRLELQSDRGDTEIVDDGHTVSLYDAASNTVYRYALPQEYDEGDSGAGGSDREVPSVAKIQEAIAHVMGHATLSGAVPTDVAGRPAYSVRLSPSRDGGLVGGAELTWDAVNGAPLRLAVYSTQSSAPVLELAATEVSYGPVASSVFDIAPPPGAKVEEVTLPTKPGPRPGSPENGGGRPTITRHGDGLEAITVVESQLKAGQQAAPDSQLEGLPKVDIDGASATELPTALGTLLGFERSGVRYLLVGAVTPAAIEAFARGL